MKKYLRVRKKGFTLIELLVVVLILGILVSVALPAYISATKTAKYNAADGNSRALASALQSNAVRTGAYATSLADTGVVADMGGAIPNNPCSASAGAAGYTLATVANGVTIVAKNDTCTGYTPTTFTLTK